MTPAAAHAARLLALGAWCAAVWTLSAQSDPADAVGFSLELPDWLFHGLEFLVGGLLARHAAVPLLGPRRGALAALLFLAAWGVLDEWHQSFVPGRDPSAGDVVADLVGACIGVGLHAAACRSTRYHGVV